MSLRAKILGLIVMILILAGLGAAYEFRLFNRPPKADFSYRTSTRTLRYFNPCSEDTILFVNESSDPDGDQLSHSWYVDGKPVGKDRDYQTQFQAGNHTVRLVVSDGRVESSIQKTIAVDEYSKYPQKALAVPIKGVMYDVGRRFMGEFGSPTSVEEMTEALEIIKNELGCNAIKVHGDYDDLLIKCAEMAIDRGFKEIVLNPRYMRIRSGEDIDIADHMRLVIDLAKKAEELRVRKNYPIVFCVGDELVDYVRGITNAASFSDRIAERDRELQKYGKDAPMLAQLNSWLLKIVESVRKEYHGTVTYASSQTTRNYIDWNALGVDIIFPHMYFSTSRNPVSFQREVIEMKRFGKPLWIAEFGCATYVGAGRWGGDYGGKYQGEAYSQEEQAESIRLTIDQFNIAKPDAIFLWIFMQRRHSDDYLSAGILKWSGTEPASRKLGFYMYKSYGLANSSPTPEPTPKVNSTISAISESSLRWLTGVAMMVKQMPSSREIKAGWRTE